MREADLLAVVKAHFGPERTTPDVLSFGCSIGDELATLRIMFPGARLHGCDIHPTALAAAQASVGHFADVFTSSDEAVAARGPYDLICAFSSLCLNPPPKGPFAAAFPFARFEQILDLFAAVLKPGGVLALYNTSYLLRHASAARTFDILRSDQIAKNGFVDLHAPDGARLLKALPTLVGRAHRVENRADLTDWDLVDCLFIRRDGPGPSAVQTVAGYDPRPDVRRTEIAAWTRSELDTVPAEERQDLIEISRVFRLFADGSGATFVEHDIHRSRLDGGDMAVGTVGLHPIGATTWGGGPGLMGQPAAAGLIR